MTGNTSDTELHRRRPESSNVNKFKRLILRFKVFHKTMSLDCGISKFVTLRVMQVAMNISKECAVLLFRP
jgi:hypothetical protein